MTPKNKKCNQTIDFESESHDINQSSPNLKDCCDMDMFSMKSPIKHLKHRKLGYRHNQIPNLSRLKDESLKQELIGNLKEQIKNEKTPTKK